MGADDLLPGVLNFRDTGGLVAEGGVSRSGVLFRSGMPWVADTPAGLARLGIRRIVDLRADDELAHAPIPDRVEVPVVRIPLFAGSSDSFFAENITLGQLYASIVDDSADRVVDVVRAVLAEQPVLVHCTVGKDRTGVTVALMLAAAGVDEGAVIADYARTETLLPAARNRAVVAYLQRMIPHATTIEELATKSPASVMATLLADLRSRYGAPAEFLRAHGLGDDEIIELRRVLIAPTP